MAEVVLAPVKSPVASPTNWAQIAGPIASMLVYAGLHLDPDLIIKVIIGIQSAVGLYVVVKHTWFTTTVLAPSVKDEMKLV